MSLFMLLGFMTLSSSAAVVFGWLQDLTSVAALINWMVICTVYLRFYYGMKKQGISRDALPWKGPLQPGIAWMGLIASGILLTFGGYIVFVHDE
jgi:amino acid transporter